MGRPASRSVRKRATMAPRSKFAMLPSRSGYAMSVYVGPVPDPTMVRLHCDRPECEETLRIFIENEAGSRTKNLYDCLLYTSDAADDLLCVDLGGRRIIN